MGRKIIPFKVDEHPDAELCRQLGISIEDWKALHKQWIKTCIRERFKPGSKKGKAELQRLKDAARKA
jgi:hypothetical protein